jgi:MFS family permease
MNTRVGAQSPWYVLAVTSLAVFAVMLDSLVLVVAFPAITQSFPAVSAAELSWVLNAYTIVYGALLIPAGRIADRIGRRRAFLIGVTLFTTASVLCGIAPSPAWLVALRMIQAAGGALLSPAALALTLAAFPPERRTLAVALNGAVGALVFFSSTYRLAY